MKKLLTIFAFFLAISNLGYAGKESSQSNIKEDIIKQIVEKTTVADDVIFKSLEEENIINIQRSEDEPEYDELVYYQSGKASFYDEKWNGRKTSNGEVFDTKLLTAAHKSLPFGTLVKVTNENNGKSVVVRINDRGPFIKGRVIDLTKAAFQTIESLHKGVTKVKLEIIK